MSDLNLISNQNEYDMPESEAHYIDTSKGEVLEAKDLSPWKIIKLTAQQMGIEIKEPRKGCKRCFGRGYSGIKADTKEPVPCNCIYTDKQKMEEAYQNKVTHLSRKQRRNLKKMLKKQNKGVKNSSKD